MGVGVVGKSSGMLFIYTSFCLLSPLFMVLSPETVPDSDSGEEDVASTKETGTIEISSYVPYASQVLLVMLNASPETMMDLSQRSLPLIHLTMMSQSHASL